MKKILSAFLLILSSNLLADTETTDFSSNEATRDVGLLESLFKPQPFDCHLFPNCAPPEQELMSRTYENERKGLTPARDDKTKSDS
ncbi:hypothetical protein ACUR5C_02310 [Aliikangiella sp. IMCC44653]